MSGSAWVQQSIAALFQDRSRRAGQGIESTVEHSWPLPDWVAALMLVAGALFVILVYYRERSVRRRPRVVLACLRIAAIAIVIFMMFGWMRHRHRTDLPDLVVLVDDSASMAIEDHFADERLRERLRARLAAADLPQARRLDLVRMLLLERDAALVGRLEQRYNVKFYFVSSSVRAASSDQGGLTEALRRAEPVEPLSRLGRCLADVLERQRGRPTAAVVYFTDGVTTEGPTISEIAGYARRKTIPLYLVGLGNAVPPRDISVGDLLVDEVVFAGDVVNFDFRLSGTGVEREAVRVTLKRSGDDRILAEQTVTVGADGVPQPVRLSFRPQETGDFQFVVEADVLADEPNAANNRRSAFVEVRDETIRVLYVQEYPNHDYRFLKNLLGRGLRFQEGSGNKSIELTTVLQDADLDYAQLDETAQRVIPVSRDELFQYDVVIFGDVNRAYLSQSVMTNLADFVNQRGGGLVFLAGPRHFPMGYRNTPLEDLLPIELDSASIPDPAINLDDSFGIELTPLGQASPNMQLGESVVENLEIWRELPELYWMLEAPELRPGARVLATHRSQTGSRGQKLPLVCMQFVGAGKVVFHATDETYRWSRYRESDVYYQRYWLQTLRYLSRAKLLGGDRTVELVLDREKEYYRGEPVQLRVRFLDDRQAPSQDDGVTVVVEREGGKRRQVQLRRDALRRGTFESVVSDLADGDYRAWIANPVVGGRSEAKRFRVIAPPGEQARLEMDRDDLESAAEVSAGKFHTLDNVDRLEASLPRGRQVRIESLPSEPVWNSWILAALFVTVLSAEWLIRKRCGML